jgi:N,N'-diacetylbacillosaminyl-diphospho-undecaprenol alpha-1,3-N-acetylgalactosaminyltransferase
MKVALLVPLDFDAWNYHRGLIQELAGRGCAVTVICPPGAYIDRLRARLRVEHIPLKVDRFINPREDLAMFRALYGVFSRAGFDVVHSNTVKPNIYGTLAAKLAGVEHVYGAVRGRGAVFAEATTLKRRALRALVMGLFAVAFRCASRVQFLNQDDLDYFVASRMIAREKAVLVRSSGVNLHEFSPEALDAGRLGALRAELGLRPGRPVVAMFSRAYWSKGVEEFIAAAETVGPKRGAQFFFVGKTEQGPDAVPAEYLRERESPHFRWLGWREDVRELLALADVVALPSYYPEGIPRTLLEAMAMGKPIVTTDSVGCREVVRHGSNGFLIPVKDVAALERALDLLVGHEPVRASFGASSRRMVEAEFDERLIVGQVLQKLYGFAA